MSLAFQLGKWGGVYWAHDQRTGGWRLCLGWLAVTLWAFDLDDVFGRFVWLEDSVALVYDAVTRGRISKPYTDPRQVIAEYDRQRLEYEDRITQLTAEKERMGRVFDAAESINRNAWSEQECFNPSEYVIDAADLTALTLALNAFYGGEDAAEAEGEGAD